MKNNSYNYICNCNCIKNVCQNVGDFKIGILMLISNEFQGNLNLNLHMEILAAAPNQKNPDHNRNR